jgi:DNA-binding NtrC family response regulator
VFTASRSSEILSSLVEVRCARARADALEALLEKHRWNVAAVAREAKMARSHLDTLISKHGLKRG